MDKSTGRAKPIIFNTEMVKAILLGWKTETRRIIRPGQLRVLESHYRMEHPEFADERVIRALCLPPYETGDVLWVRETWAAVRDVTPWPHGAVGDTLRYIYRADDAAWNMDEYAGVRWKPCIHMPKEAARLFLEAKAVWPERLQRITPGGCLREGVEPNIAGMGESVAKGMFAHIWNGTMDAEKKKRYGWEANPWVWVIRFRVMDTETGTYDAEKIREAWR